MSKETMVIGDLDSAVKFLKEHAEETEVGFNLSKKEAVKFMASAGVPEAAHKQVQTAEGLLLNGMFRLNCQKVLQNIDKAKKTGVDVTTEPIVAVSKITTLGNNKHRIVSTSSRVGTIPKTGERTQSFGRTRIISDYNRQISKEDRLNFVADCKKHCGVC